jgi:hypothetical protein
MIDIRHFVLESAGFTWATLTGNWSRWLIIVLLGLPWMVLTALADSWKVIDTTGVHWRNIPWGEAGFLVIVGFLCNFILTGYLVRLLRGDPTPPEFNRWLLLLRDGIKVHTIPLVWMFVPLLLAYIQYSISSSELRSGGHIISTMGWAMILLLLLIQLIILFIAAQYAIVGAIRFARTGSLWEAFMVMSIKKTLDEIGIINYFIGLGIITAIWIVSSFLLRVITYLSYAGPELTLVLSPVLTVFCIRFIAHSCDEDLPNAVREEAVVPPVPLRTTIPDTLAWLAILGVLFFLCFTPIALVVGSITGYFP